MPTEKSIRAAADSVLGQSWRGPAYGCSPPWDLLQYWFWDIGDPKPRAVSSVGKNFDNDCRVAATVLAGCYQYVLSGDSGFLYKSLQSAASGNILSKNQILSFVNDAWHYDDGLSEESRIILGAVTRALGLLPEITAYYLNNSVLVKDICFIEDTLDMARATYFDEVAEGTNTDQRVIPFYQKLNDIGHMCIPKPENQFSVDGCKNTRNKIIHTAADLYGVFCYLRDGNNLSSLFAPGRFFKNGAGMGILTEADLKNRTTNPPLCDFSTMPIEREVLTRSILVAAVLLSKGAYYLRQYFHTNLQHTCYAEPIIEAWQQSKKYNKTHHKARAFCGSLGINPGIRESFFNKDVLVLEYLHLIEGRKYKASAFGRGFVKRKDEIFTQKYIDELELPKKKTVFVWDAGMKHFGIKLNPTGKVFVIQTRVNGRTRRVKVGDYGDLTLKQAHDKAQAMLAEIVNDKDAFQAWHWAYFYRTGEPCGASMDRVSAIKLLIQKYFKTDLVSDYHIYNCVRLMGAHLRDIGISKIDFSRVKLLPECNETDELYSVSDAWTDLVIQMIARHMKKNNKKTTAGLFPGGLLNKRTKQ